MAGIRFTVMVEGISTSNTQTSIVGVKAPANQRVNVLGVVYGFDGTTTTDGPGLIEVMNCTAATNCTPGTNNTSVTPIRWGNYGSETIQSSGMRSWTSEPTVLSLIIAHSIPTLMGSAHIEFQNPIPIAGGSVCVLRIKLPSGVTHNFTGGLICEE